VKIQTAHCDGDTIGHRCCKVHDCKIPLDSNRQHFCPDHQHMTLKCAVIDCPDTCATSFRTCSDVDHRALETAYFTRGKSLYKLRSRLKKAGVAVPANSILDGGYDDDDDDEVIIERWPCRGRMRWETKGRKSTASSLLWFTPHSQRTVDYALLRRNSCSSNIVWIGSSVCCQCGFFIG
jgi:hypothetical protein